MRISPAWIGAGVASVLAAGCGGEGPATTGPQQGRAQQLPEAGISATATLKPASGSQVSGTVNFTQEAGGVHVAGNIAGLSPGKHGFHVHEIGDCSDPEAKSAGGHFNPAGMDHGAPDAPAHHVGDLGNLEADEQGRANIDRTFSGLTLSGANAIMGKALLVHAGEDDLTSQPAGNAGARVACGVIQAGRPAGG